MVQDDVDDGDLRMMGSIGGGEPPPRMDQSGKERARGDDGSTREKKRDRQLNNSNIFDSQRGDEWSEGVSV